MDSAEVFDPIASREPGAEFEEIRLQNIVAVDFAVHPRLHHVPRRLLILRDIFTI